MMQPLRKPRQRHLLFALLISCSAIAAPPSSELLSRIPEDLRDPAARVLDFDQQGEAGLLTLSDLELRAAILTRLAYKEAAATTVLTELRTEPPPTQQILLEAVAYAPHWLKVPDADEVLRAIVATDRDPAIVVKALETLRTLEMKRLRAVLRQRISAARATSDAAMFDRLAMEDERYVSLQRGTMLPGFLRTPPNLFSVKTKSSAARIVVFGDFGRGRPGQTQVAQAIAKLHRQRRFDVGLTTGDNFYGSGMHSPDDQRWKPQWEDLYAPLRIPFYASLGNHDWIHPDAPAAEILYSDKSVSWRMPSPYYSFTVGPAQFFVLSTEDFSEAQAQWLTRSLAASSATWKLVVGHHPIAVASQFGADYTSEMRERVWPLIRGRVDAYLCGHHHSLQHLKPEDGVHFFVSGAGGASTYPVNESDSRALFAQSQFGFLVLNAGEKQLVATFYDADAKPLHSHTIEKPTL